MKLFLALVVALLLPCIFGTPACTSVDFSGVVYETDGLWNPTNQIFSYKFHFDVSTDPSNVTFPNCISVQLLQSTSSNATLYTSTPGLYFVIDTPDGTSDETVSCSGPQGVCNVSATNGIAANTFKLTVPGGFISVDDVTGLSVNGGKFYDGSNQIAFDQINQCLSGNSDTITAQHYYKYSQSVCCTAITDFADPTTAPPPTDDPSTIGTACSTDSSLAWLDVIFVIDISRVMTKLTDLTTSIATVMENFPIGQNSDHSTRVAIVAYGKTNVTVITGLVDTTDGVAFEANLFALQTDSSDVGGGIQGGLRVAWDMIQAQRGYRKPAIVLSSAAYDEESFQNAVYTAQGIRADGISVVVLNYGANDGVVADVLKNISSPGYYYLSTQDGLIDSMTYGLTQINCFCLGTTLQLQISHPQWGNHTSYADCLRGIPDEASPSLAENHNCPPGVLISLTTEEKFHFALENLFTSNISHSPPMLGKKQFNTGLHKASDGTWKWWGYNGTEFPYNNYPPMINVPAPSDNYGAMINIQGFQWGIKTGRNVPYSYICQTRACDASYICRN